MKQASSLFLKTVVFTAVALVASCESNEGPRKKKPVPPPGTNDISGLPLNRPRGFESGSGMGRMMPQSR